MGRRLQIRPIPKIMGGMTMAPYEDDDVPTLKEVSRTLRDFRDEFRLQMGMMVRKDVHTVEHEALLTRLGRLEAGRENDEKTRATTRNQFYLALFVGGLGLVSTIVMSMVK